MLAAFFASMVVVGLAGLATLTIGVDRRVESQEPPEEQAPETPIEEILAESGEDPGAVYSMSRVREAIGEGSPTFTRELSRQMKKVHPKSVLIEEAKALFANGRERS